MTSSLHAALLSQLLALLRDRRADAESRARAKLTVERHQLTVRYGVEATLGQHFDVRQIHRDDRQLLTRSDSVTAFADWNETETVPLEDVCVRDAVGLTDAALFRATRNKGIVYSPHPHSIADGLAVRVVPALLNAILPQLLLTVVSFLRARDSMFVRVMGVGDRVWIRVTDAGIGLADHAFALNMQPFVRPREKYLQEGVGLQFAKIRKLAHEMNGELSIVRAPNNSSSFTLVLPRSWCHVVSARSLEDHAPTTLRSAGVAPL